MDGTRTSGVEADEVAIRELEAAYDRAWDAADLPALMRLFADGVVVIDPLGRTSTGRDEVERMLESVLDGFGKGSTHASVIEVVSIVTDTVALADGEAVIVGLRDAEGDVQAPFHHRFTDVVVKSGAGDWRIAHVRACAPVPPD
jgi:uncharacterized protein (TIGR02246 family)